MNSRSALDALNFLLPDVKDAVGPFLAIYLTSDEQWDRHSAVLGPRNIGQFGSASGACSLSLACRHW